MPAVPARTLIRNSNVIKNDQRGAGSEDTDTCSASVGTGSGTRIKVSLRFSQRRLTFCSEHRIRPQSLTSETETGGNCFATTLLWETANETVDHHASVGQRLYLLRPHSQKLGLGEQENSQFNLIY